MEWGDRDSAPRHGIKEEQHSSLGFFGGSSLRKHAVHGRGEGLHYTVNWVPTAATVFLWYSSATFRPLSRPLCLMHESKKRKNKLRKRKSAFLGGREANTAAGGRTGKDNNWAAHKQKMKLHFHGRGSNLKKYILSMFLHKKEETR